MKKFTLRIRFIVLMAGLLFFSFNASAATIFSEAFGTNLGNFTAKSVKGNQVWGWSSYNSVGFAKISGFVSNVNYVNDDWLISPSMDFSDVTKANLSFDNAYKYGASPEYTLTLWATDSYSGGDIDTTKWKAISFTHSTGNFVFANSGLVALDSYAGKENVRFAFRYRSDTLISASTWEVNNVKVESAVDNSPKTVLQENFDKFTMGTLASPTGTDYSAADSLNKYMTVSGWTGAKIYSAGGVLKFGSSSALGSITTPALDLSAYSGKFSISFDAAAWSGDATSVKILLNDVLAKQVDGLPNNAAPYVLKSFGPFELTGGTATSKITISGLQASKGRFLLDNIKITQGGVPAASASVTSASFSVEKGGNQTKDIILKASNLTGDLTVAVVNKAGSAFSTTVSSITAAQATDTAGFKIPVKYMPSAAGNDTATVTISGGGLDQAVSATVTGACWVAVSVADLAALRAAYNANPTDTKTVYNITGEVIVSYMNNSGNTKYVQDANGGVCIFDTKGLITSTYAVGSGMKNLKGTLAVYGKLLELVPVADVTPSSTGNSVAFSILTIPEIRANYEKYENKLVQINSLTCNKTGNFASKANYMFYNGADSIALRTNYSDLDYIGTAIPTTATNIRGILIQYNGTIQFVPRYKSDFGVPSALNNAAIEANIYGSDGILNVEAVQGQLIEVYNILGQKLLSRTANDGINTFRLGSNQMVIVKVGRNTSKIVL